MGTLESKIKEGYSIKQRPSFKAKQKYGTRPVNTYQPKNQFASTTIYRNIDTKLSYGTVARSTRTDDTENSEKDIQI
jgi:hypothetical protein